MNKINFKLSGLTCDACSKLVSNRFGKIPGVTAVSIDRTTGQAEVISEAAIERKVFDQSLEGTEYSIVNHNV